jgi:hypothetical protein
MIWKSSLLTFFAALVVLFAPWSCLEAAKGEDFKEVDGVSKPLYRQRSGDAWKNHGRIVGRALHAPKAYQFNYYSTGENGKFLFSDEFDGDISVYESTWLLPGHYRIIIKASGFHDFEIKDVEVKKGHDCVMDVMFGTKMFYVY